MAAVVTRAAKSAADFTHVTETLLGRPQGDELLTALTEGGYVSVSDILNLSAVDIENHSYTDANNTVPSVQRGKLNLLRIFKAYVSEQNWVREEHVDTQSLLRDDFDVYRATRYDPDAHIEPWVPAQNRASSAASRGSGAGTTQGGQQGGRAMSPKDNFIRNIKRDSSRYTAFKDEKQWDTWNRCFRATIRSQQLHNVIDENYVPGTKDTQDLFHAQNTFVYTILVDNLQTDFGKSLVRSYESSNINQFNSKK